MEILNFFFRIKKEAEDVSKDDDFSDAILMSVGIENKPEE
jgi:hypothetical protein